jgi:cytoskeletal protein RodZ
MQRFITKGYSKGYSKGYAEMLYLWGFELLLVYSVYIYKDIII